MNITRFLPLIGLFLTLVSHAKLPVPKPKIVEVPLKEYTTMTVEVVPNMGTRLTFPFKLSEQTPEPMIANTNPLLFQVNGVSSGKVPTNTRELVITANAPESLQEAAGNLFISVGGYQISVALKLKYELKTHLTDYRFKLTDDELNYFIEKAVERRVAAEKKSLAEDRANLEQLAKNEALGYMGIVALNRPEVDGFATTRDVKLENGDEFEIYLEELQNYSNEYFMLTFELEHEGLKTLALNSYRLGYYKSRSDETGVEWLEPIHVTCPDRLMPEDTVRCAIVTTDADVLKNKKLELRVQTSEGEMVALW